MNFDTIILSGGASRGYYQLGCLYKYRDRISSVRRYVGTSVGALICLLLCCDISIEEIMKSTSRVSMSFPPIADMAANLIAEYGMMKINPYVRAIEYELKKKYGYIPTLKQLFEITGRKLIVTGSCLTTGELVYLSSDTFPEMPCTLAVDISSRVPYVFTPILWDGHLYIDGGLHEHFPISQVQEDERTLAIYTCGRYAGAITSISDISPLRYFWYMVNSMTRGRYSSLTSTDMCTVHMISGWGGYLSASPEEALGMFLLGFLSSPCSKRC